MEIVTVELVGGGLAEWPSGKGPRRETIAPAAYIDVTGAEHLLELPHQFHAAGAAGWRADGTLEPEPPALRVAVSAPNETAFHIPLDVRRHAALVAAMLRDRGIYIVPTLPRLGINARLARDGSVWVDINSDFADTWRRMREK